MAKKKEQVNTEINVENGAYFTATYDRKKISGIVDTTSMRYGDFYLYSNDDGEDDDCDNNDVYSFSICVGLEDFSKVTTADLEKGGVTNFKVVTDKATIEKIESSILPEVLGYPAKRTLEGNISFGCGAVEVSPKEAKSFLKVLEITRGQDLSVDALIDRMSSYDIDKTAKLLTEWLAAYEKVKKLSKDEKTVYKDVCDEIRGQGHDIEDLSISQVKELVAAI